MSPRFAMSAAVLTLAALRAAAAEPVVIDLWPGKVPGQVGAATEEKMTGNLGARQLTDVTKPTVTVFRPAAEHNAGAAVVIAPGGGYRILAWDHEGLDVAKWLNSVGVTAVLLKYRVPRLPDHPKYPLQDAQRAISLTRSKAREWGIDPAKVGMLGFSAGGHLTATTATNFDKRAYDAVDDADKASCRPDFAVIVYPGGVVRDGVMAPEVRASKDSPPAFLIQSTDDRVGIENSVQLFMAFKKAGVPAELHAYATGGHGYGMRKTGNASATWPSRVEDWMRGMGVLPKAGGAK